MIRSIALTKTALCVMLLLTSVFAQDTLGGRKLPSVTLIPPGVADISKGKSNIVNLDFQVGPGFHINSNKPSAEYMIPTVLRLDPPTDITVGKINYPAGEEMSFPFAPNEKLSVYSGRFTVGVTVRPLSGVLPGKYEFRGQMRYQACDNAACYPPKQLPVQFEVKVLKAPPPHRKNPPQSPNVHN
ncbi:MAG TPA: protein-disulfide reductase DsbD N-terminal domain-containing protein [Terriglobales bacterium]|jgi:hypothetical protein|nr:protein-disulfide reductase DsbD N-terminal domain-containing protein [Terriglobales bacterium]